MTNTTSPYVDYKSLSSSFVSQRLVEAFFATETPEEAEELFLLLALLAVPFT